MSTKPIICYLKSLSASEIDSINKYWETDPDSNNGFAYTLKEIDAKKDVDCGAVSGLVYKSCALVPHSNVFYCGECQKATPVRNRAQFKNQIKLPSHECEECRERKLSALKEECANLITNYLSSRLNQKDYFQELSYLDCIILLAILSNDYQENKPVFSAEKALNLTGSEHLDATALSRFIEIGALIDLQELPENIVFAEQKLYECSNNQALRRRRGGYEPCRNALTIEKGLYFSLPPQFENYFDFYVAINQRVINKDITTKEGDELKRLVISMRVENLYRLIDHISCEFNLEIKKSNPLSALLHHLSEHYPITKCYFTFYHFAKEVLVYSHKNNTNYYVQGHLFTKFVSRYIENLEENEWELRLSRKLPESIYTSSVEALVSLIFIDGHFNWNSLTANEVIERWLSNTPVLEGQVTIYL